MASQENGDIKSEIYENLPCDVSGRPNRVKTGDMEGNTEAPAIVPKTPAQTKESLYATPLRKSERPTTGRTSTSSSSRGEKGRKEEKRNSSHSNKSSSVSSSSNRKKGTTEKSSTNSTAEKNPVGIPNQDPILEQRRMRNFLKDQAPPVTPSHKANSKVDPASQMNSNFSALAQEEHFANLVHQNVLNNVEHNKRDDDTTKDGGVPEKAIEEEPEEEEGANPLDETMTLEELENKCLKNLELLTQKAAAAVEQESLAKEGADTNEEEQEGLFLLRANRLEIPPERMFIKREWALKKILICLEQRSSKRSGGNGSELAEGVHSHVHQPNNLPQLGALVLGSNGSGKSTICQSILDGGNGTKGILNRRLLCCYLISSQSPECHSISIFIRSLVLQILSHSSYLFRDEGQTVGNESAEAMEEILQDMEEDEEKRDEGKSEIGGAGSSTATTVIGAEDGTGESTTNSVEPNSKLSRLTSEKIKELEEMLITELQFAGHGSPILGRKAGIVRQQSEPVGAKEGLENSKQQFGSNPLLNNSKELKSQQSTPKKISKIPVKIGSCRGSPKISLSNENETDEAGKKEEDTAKDTKISLETDKQAEGDPLVEIGMEKPLEALKATEDEDEKSVSVAAPPPLPKIKDCRTIIADSYYELLMSNPEIMESLSVDCIEKNPDECFKKAILFPLLELNPPKSSLLFLIDSIDEHYITESSLISTLKKSSRGSGGASAASTKSQNIAELLAQNVNLLPKWLFLVCTGKKQNKHITKLFSGFKKITIDDLRKSHVVKDVQEYIILRLNTDFRNAINLTKDVIDSLNQLYLKSNGCILYLQKVMNGIKEGFFTFREIRMLPCSLNGLYLYICQKSFNKKQFNKIRPILNVLLAIPQAFVDKEFVFNCLRTQNYSIDEAEFEQRLEVMRHVLVFDKDGQMLRIFHNSFADWLIDVKFSTKKFLCDVNEGHVMIAMYYAWISERLCPNMVRRFVYHLIKAGEYLQGKNQPLDLVLFLLETRANLSDCFYTNSLSCCRSCELGAKAELNLNLPRTRQMISNYIDKALKNEQLQEFLQDFFKPNLPTDGKSLKLLIETGINNADTQVSGRAKVMMKGVRRIAIDFREDLKRSGSMMMSDGDQISSSVQYRGTCLGQPDGVWNFKNIFIQY